MRLGLTLLSVSLVLSGCIYRLTVSAADGERLIGRYRFGRDGSGLVQLVGPDGEVFMGKRFASGAQLLSKVIRRLLGRALSQWMALRFLFQPMASAVSSEIRPRLRTLLTQNRPPLVQPLPEDW